MEKQIVLIDAQREGYSTDQIRHTMTVGELIAYLEQFEDDSPVYLSHDNGYTYGGIRQERITDDYVDKEDYGDEEDN